MTDTRRDPATDPDAAPTVPRPADLTEPPPGHPGADAFIVTHWLVARSAHGFLTGLSADHPRYGPGFIRAHTLAGNHVTRHDTAEMTARLQRPSAPYRSPDGSPAAPHDDTPAVPHDKTPGPARLNGDFPDAWPEGHPFAEP